MSEAITLFFNLFNPIVEMFFNLELMPGVSLGWILVTVVIISAILVYFKGGRTNA